MRRKGGFTMIELMMVVIIVAILAAVAVPLYRANVRRAYASEAVATLGAIRSAERTYYAEHGEYLSVAAGDLGNMPTDADPGLGIDCSQNRYWSADAFEVTASGNTFTATATGDDSTAPEASKVAGIVITMDQTGAITYTWP